jgi:hypothetical protein
MATVGEDTTEGVRFLDLLRSVLTEFHVHRRMILDELARG